MTKQSRAPSVLVPGFRVFVLVLMGVGAIAVTWWLIHESQQSAKREQERGIRETAERVQREAERAKAASLVEPKYVGITDFSLTYAYGDTWNLNGSIYNSSQHTLISVTVEIVLRSCVGADGKFCPVIGQQTAELQSPTEIPPGQARAFSKSVAFPGTPKSPYLAWKYEIKGTQARPISKAAQPDRVPLARRPPAAGRIRESGTGRAFG